jgi:flagellar biosynthesis protein FlhF
VNIKTYQAFTMAEALAAVKEDLGHDAVILHTRAFKRGGFMGLGKRNIVEVSASPAREVGEKRRTAAKAAGARRAYGTAAPARTATTAKLVAADVHETESDDRRAAAVSQLKDALTAAGPAPAAAADLAALLASGLSPNAQAAVAAGRAGTGTGTAAAAVQATGTAGIAARAPAAAPRPPVPVDEEPPRRPTRVARRFHLQQNGATTTVVPAADDQPPLRRAGQQQAGRPAAASASSKSGTAIRAAQPAAPGAVTTTTAPSGALPTRPVVEIDLGTSPSPTVRTRTLFRDEPDLDITPPPVVIGDAMQQELASIKAMVGHVLQRQTATAGTMASPTMPARLLEAYLALVGQELSDDLSGRIVDDVRERLGDAALEDEAVVREAVIDRLAALIPVADEPLPTDCPEDRPLTIALIGPTGVGKTTTLAKLAASYKLRHHRRVGLITADTYRIAAVDQLRTYANIIGLPLQVALTPADMRQSMHALSDCDVVLIDTAGRSQADTERVRELESFIAAAEPHETHLVLSAVAAEKVLMQEAEVFGAVGNRGADKVVFTKLDEAVSFGALVNVVRHLDKPISFFTNGQEVPDHIERGDARRLAELVVRGTLAK